VTRLQRLLCLVLGILATAAVVAATLVHNRAEAGRRALDEADRAHVGWFEQRVGEAAALARLRDLRARQTALRLATARTHRRLLAALDRSRHARRRVVGARPLVVYRVRTVLASGGSR
jgi:type II secretory pathway component PulK